MEKASVDERKLSVNVFPFYKVKKESTVVLYGAGSVGTDYLYQVQQSAHCRVIYVADKRHQEITNISGVRVVSPENLRQSEEYDFVVISSAANCDSMFLFLRSIGVPESKIVSAFPYGTISYAGSGEDVAIYMIFKFLGKETFSYVDVGANDPYRGSVTAFFYVKGCRGINIEANPDLVETLKMERPEDVTINVGIGTEEGVLPYYMFSDNRFNTFEKDAIQEVENYKSDLVEVRQISVVPLQKIVNLHANGKWPDFLQIDAEGWDYIILKSCDFTQSAPSVICVEAGDWNLHEMTPMLNEKGYELFFRIAANAIYVRKDIVKRICAGEWSGRR